MLCKGSICDEAQLMKFEKGIDVNRLAVRKPPLVSNGREAGRNRGKESS